MCMMPTMYQEATPAGGHIATSKRSYVGEIQACIFSPGCRRDAAAAAVLLARDRAAVGPPWGGAGRRRRSLAARPPAGAAAHGTPGENVINPNWPCAGAASLGPLGEDTQP